MAPKKDLRLRHLTKGRRSQAFRSFTPGSYNHINTQEAAPPEEPSTPLQSDDFVPRPSLQDIITEGLESATRVASKPLRASSPPVNGPMTFAQATMSTQVSDTTGGGASRDGDSQGDGPMGSNSSKSLAILRPKKKKKVPKWTPLDLSDIVVPASVIARRRRGSGNRSPQISPRNASPSFRIPTPQPQPTTTTSLPSTSPPTSPTPQPSQPLQSPQLELQPLQSSPLQLLPLRFTPLHSPPPQSPSQLPDLNRETDELSATVPSITEEGEAAYENSLVLADAEPAPSQQQAHASPPSIYFNDPDSHLISGYDLAPIREDSPQTATKFKSAMSGLHQFIKPAASGDAFDSMEWDPDLPRGSASAEDMSPEKIEPKPKPVVAYTTVGSVVNPNNVPQFSAPNRIQREGAGRRPLMTMTNRQYDSLLQPRGPPTPLGMQSSMQYTQHLQLIPATYDPPRPRSAVPSNQPTATTPTLTDQETQVLGRLDAAIQSIALKSSKSAASAISTAPSYASAFNITSTTVAPYRRGLLQDDEDLKRTYGSQGKRQGLEKMQTLQRLAKFENPMREHALSRLSEFSVHAQAVSNANARESMVRGQQQSGESMNGGELNKGFQFPPPGLSSANMTNPLFHPFASSALNSSAPPHRPPGYPQPLTAGPPGQRQANQAFLSTRICHSSMAAAEATNIFTSMTRQSSGFASNTNFDLDFTSSAAFETGSSAGVSNQAGPAIENPFQDAPSRPRPDPFRLSNYNNISQYQQKADDTHYERFAVTLKGGLCQTPLYDSLQDDRLSQYYPKGPPSGKGYPRPLTKAIEAAHKVAEKEGSTTEEVKRAEHSAGLNDWFYHGQARYSMTAEDHVVELERREMNPHGPIEPSRKGPVVHKPLTPEEAEQQPISEAVKPMLDGLFGTLLSYAESSDRSRTKSSKWSNTDPKLFDTSVEGNQSCFGEDWGQGWNREKKDKGERKEDKEDNEDNEDKEEKEDKGKGKDKEA